MGRRLLQASPHHPLAVAPPHLHPSPLASCGLYTVENSLNYLYSTTGHVDTARILVGGDLQGTTRARPRPPGLLTHTGLLSPSPKAWPRFSLHSLFGLRLCVALHATPSPAAGRSGPHAGRAPRSGQSRTARRRGNRPPRRGCRGRCGCLVTN